MGIVGA